MTVLLKAVEVTKKFGDFQALGGLNLEVQAGECVGLLGPNGAGKSTFISTIYGATLRSGGKLEVFGMDPSTNSRGIKERLGVVPQENALDEALTVRENMQLYAAFLGVPKGKRDGRITELLQYMQLDHRANAPIRTLSGGMKRRLAFVRALLGDPELVVLDEPTTGLDPAVRHLLWQKVTELKRQRKTILVTTHYMHEAEVLCERVVILNKGKIVDSASPNELIERHTPGFVGLFPGGEVEAKLRKLANPAWVLFEQRGQTFVRAPKLEDLLRLQEAAGVQALQLRPANLEDVFLKITGEELSAND